MDGFVLTALVVLGLQGGLGSGGAGGDLVSFLPTNTYLQSRRIPLNVENLEALARAEPKDGKTQILQLMALRALAEQPELIKKAPGSVLATIEKIARGEIARDRFGFSEEYARRTLIALGSKITLPQAAQPADLREEALGWFPASSTLVGFVGGPLPASTGDYGDEVRKFLSKLRLRPRDWNEVFNVVEMIGNARIDRIGFAYAADDQNKEKARIYVRITGKWDHQRFVAAIKTAFKNESNFLKWDETKDVKGTPVTMAHFTVGGPAFALIGDTDLLLGQHVREPAGSQGELIQHLLAVRAGKEKSVLKGALQDRLPVLSAETTGLLLGDLPEELRRAVFQQAGLLAPKSIRVEIQRSRDRAAACFQATLANADDAKAFAESVGPLRQVGLAGLKKMQEETKEDTPLPRSAVASLRKALESLKVEPDGAGVKGTLLVPSEALPAVLWLPLGSTGAIADPAPPRPVEPEQK